MPARPEWIQSESASMGEGNVSDSALVAAARGIFSDFPYAAEDLEARRGHIVFQRGTQGVLLTSPHLNGMTYVDFARVMREHFAAALRASVGPVLHSSHAAGFTYSLNLGGVS